jgi:hypothetical protein
MPILESDTEIAALLARTKRIAVLGMKTEAAADQPAFYVAKACLELGYDIFPVPVYYPEATHILGLPVFRRVSDVTPKADMVDVFRRPKDLAAHLDDLLSARPKSVWLQLGIVDDAFANTLSEAGIDVVQDRCLMVEARRFARG